MDMTSRVSNTTVAVFTGFVGLALLAMTNWGDEAFVLAIMREDGPIENVTAIMYLLGAIACGIALYRRQNFLLAGIWLFLCVLFLGEETSWFQRLFDYSVPEVEKMSVQAEFNLHNLTLFGGGRVLAPDGVNLSMETLLNSQNIFRLGFASYFLLLPALCVLPPFRRFAVGLGYVAPSPLLLFTAWSVIVISFVMTVTTVPPVKAYVAEARELFYATTIFFYVSGLAKSEAVAGKTRQQYAR